jgi:uncharacterized protein (TIGR03083 family)
MEESAEVLAGIARGVGMTRRIVAGIAAEQWSAPSPCVGWSVRDVLNHVVGGMRIFAAELTDANLRPAMTRTGWGPTQRARTRRPPHSTSLPGRRRRRSRARS